MPTLCFDRWRSTRAGMSLTNRANTSRWAGAPPRNTWRKSNRSSINGLRRMNPKSLTTRWQDLPEQVVRQLQAEKLRHYLRRVVLPFSAHYRELFRQHGLAADSIRSLDDLQRLPFSSKTDLLNTPEHPQRVRDFLLIPDPNVLARRPSTILRALCQGRERVKHGFEAEFRPIFMTSTTGRSTDPIPFLFTQHDLNNLAMAGKRLFEICGAQCA